jgi:tRNA A37 threonylcarbamoyladenosine synthetase subunit TsaC/SUA5/YrdC
LAELGTPIASTSAYLLDADGQGIAETIGAIDKAELFDHWESLVDLIIDDDPDEPQTRSDRLSTILDLTGESPEIIRKGEGWEEAMNWI